MRYCAALIAAFACSAPVAADEYRCQVTPGLVRYQNVPCDSEATAARAAIEAKLKRESDEMKKETELSAAKEHEQWRRDPWGISERACTDAFRDQMKYLEPVGPYAHMSRGGKDSMTLRVDVRFADSFRAAPIGVVECWVTLEGRGAYLTKVPR